jgi:hypothetical protein
LMLLCESNSKLKGLYKGGYFSANQSRLEGMIQWKTSNGIWLFLYKTLCIVMALMGKQS